MTERLTQAQFAQVVAEAERIAQRREAELDADQVKEILRDLNLSPDLYEEALIQLRRREALAAQQQRRRWLLAGLGAAAAVLVAGSLVLVQRQQQGLANLSAYQDRITLAGDQGSSLTTVDRQTSPKVTYRVTLQNAPIGQRVELRCDWRDPNGQVAHQNLYRTRTIDRTAWPTSCAYQMGPANVPGPWTVEIAAGGRSLSRQTFTVR